MSGTALHEQLNKFKKQQEKCQSTLQSIAAKAGPSKSTATTFTPRPIAASPIPNARTPSPAVKFPNDTERLQHINSIRKAPVGAQIKRVIDLLLETVNYFSMDSALYCKPHFEQLFKETGSYTKKFQSSGEKKNGLVARILKNVVNVIEQRMSTETKNLKDQNNLYKTRAEKYQSKIRVLETLAAGTKEEIEVLLSKLEQIKVQSLFPISIL